MKISEKAFKAGDKVALKNHQIFINTSPGSSHILRDELEVIFYQTKREEKSVKDELKLLCEIEEKGFSSDDDLLTGSVWCKHVHAPKESINLYVESDLELISSGFYEVKITQIIDPT